VAAERDEFVADHWFEPLADHMGPAYLRYSFTKHTVREVDFLVEVLGLTAEDHVLDVGCGPGRHVVELARRGIRVTGLDISRRFLDLAGAAALDAGVDNLVSLHRADARDLDGLDLGGPFDACVAMCQGAFGLQAGPAAACDPVNLGGDRRVLDGMVAQLRSGGRLGVAAFSAYFQVQHLEHSTFDAMTGTNHEQTEVHDANGEARPAELWTTCFTPRELWLLLQQVGVEPEAVHSVSSVGAYQPTAPTVDEPEFFCVARKP